MTTAFQPQTAARRHVSLVYPASLRPIDRERPGRRVLNIVVALAGMVLALPLMLVIAALVKLTSRGPVLFRQAPIGLDRRSLSRAGGITGWAQVSQGYDCSVDDVRRKLARDLAYIRRQSALEDLRIMLRTVPVMLFRRGGW